MELSTVSQSSGAFHRLSDQSDDGAEQYELRNLHQQHHDLEIHNSTNPKSPDMDRVSRDFRSHRNKMLAAQQKIRNASNHMARQDPYLIRMNLLNTRYGERGELALGHDLKVEVEKIWRTMRNINPRNEPLPKSNRNYRLFIRLAREVQTLVCFKETANKALANLDMWRDKLVLDGRPDAHEVARSDFQIMWKYRLTQAVDRLVAFHTAMERLPLKGLAQVHLHCKKLFEAELEEANKIDLILFTLKKIHHELQVPDNDVTSDSVTLYIMRKGDQFRAIKCNGSFKGRIESFMKALKTRLHLEPGMEYETKLKNLDVVSVIGEVIALINKNII